MTDYATREEARSIAKKLAEQLRYGVLIKMNRSTARFFLDTNWFVETGLSGRATESWADLVEAVPSLVVNHPCP